MQKRLATGAFSNVEEVIRRALEAQDQEESWTEQERRALDEKIDRAIEQAAEGKVYGPEEARRKLAAMREARSAGQSRWNVSITGGPDIDGSLPTRKKAVRLPHCRVHQSFYKLAAMKHGHRLHSQRAVFQSILLPRIRSSSACADSWSLQAATVQMRAVPAPRFNLRENIAYRPSHAHRSAGNAGPETCRSSFV